MFIRPEKNQDIDAIRELNDEAFGGSDESRIIQQLRNSGMLSLSLVAFSENKVVGHIAFSPIQLDSTQGKNKFMGLAPMSVSPDHQRRGIGSQLVKEALRILKEGGVSAVFVLGHPDYYPKFGFKTGFFKLWDKV